MKNLWYWDRNDLLNNGLNETQLPKESSIHERFECMQPNPDINSLDLIRGKITIFFMNLKYLLIFLFSS